MTCVCYSKTTVSLNAQLLKACSDAASLVFGICSLNTSTGSFWPSFYISLPKLVYIWAWHLSGGIFCLGSHGCEERFHELDCSCFPSPWISVILSFRYRSWINFEMWWSSSSATLLVTDVLQLPCTITTLKCDILACILWLMSLNRLCCCLVSINATLVSWVLDYTLTWKIKFFSMGLYHKWICVCPTGYACLFQSQDR